MKLESLGRFAPLYLSPVHFGAGDALRSYLSVPESYVLPLSVSHGVDFGQMFSVLDVNGLEPLHWAFNEEMLVQAQFIKPAIAIPHPFLLAADETKRQRGAGTLVIGPPPGPLNDQRLLSLLNRSDDVTILVKPKRNFAESANFWRQNGFTVATAADDGPPSYFNTARLIGRYERVMSCTFSSALFFAAALGKPTELIRGYRYRVWEVPELPKIFDFQSSRARKVAAVFASQEHDRKTNLARQILGANLEVTPASIRSSLSGAIQRLQEPLHFAFPYPKPIRLMLGELALRLGKPGLVSRSPASAISAFKGRDVLLQELDEVALWLGGHSSCNPQLTSSRYVRGKTVPGDAVEPY